jgi:hypothetical protein
MRLPIKTLMLRSLIFNIPSKKAILMDKIQIDTIANGFSRARRLLPTSREIVTEGVGAM